MLIWLPNHDCTSDGGESKSKEWMRLMWASLSKPFTAVQETLTADNVHRYFTLTRTTLNPFALEKGGTPGFISSLYVLLRPYGDLYSAAYICLLTTQSQF